MAKVQNGVEKIAENFNRLSTLHERYRRQTDDRQTDGRTGDSMHIANVNVSWRSQKVVELYRTPAR